MADYNSSLPIRTEQNGDVAVKVVDNTVPSQGLTVNADGSVNITDNGGSLTVDATNLDIRDLTSASDSVEVLQNTHDDLNANANIQVNNTDVGNANPVPVSDAGGSLTVDATDLDIRNLVFATDKVDVSGSSITATVSATDLDIRDLDAAQDNVAISDGTDTLAINADGSLNAVVTATDLDIRNLVFATDKVDVSGSTVALDAGTLAALESITVQNGAGAAAVNIQDGGNSITVDANNLDIRDLTHVSDSVKIGDGTDFLAINADGSINVVPQEDAGTEVVNYNTASAVAGAATSNHDYAVTNGGRLYQVYASASGKLKAEVQIETGSATNTFNTVIVGFNSTATPNIDMSLAKYATIPTGARVRVIRTNNDNQAQNLYSTIVLISN